MTAERGSARRDSIRERNLQFLHAIAEALQVDKMDAKQNFPALKKAFTPAAVRKIHAAIPRIWPDGADWRACVERGRDAVTGLYCGSYEPEAVFRALSRHTLYSDRIILPDPFMYAPRVAEQYSPVLHPEMHRMTTIKWTFLWWSLMPWIESGLVGFIRTPGDFNATELHEILNIQRSKFESTPDLRAVMEEEAERMVNAERGKQNGWAECMWLMRSDEDFRKTYSELGPNNPWPTVEAFLDEIRARRVAHPYFVDRLPGQESEFLQETTGAPYEAAKRICAVTGYYVLTDRRSKWKEVEIDHEYAGDATRTWSPLGKALQGANLTVLNDIPLQSLLHLRQENRLEGMRHFFSRVWQSCREPAQYSEENATRLAAELDDRVREAEAEWKKIDIELMKWVGVSATPLLAAGAVGFFPSAVAVAAAGLVALKIDDWRRKSFERRFPAGFFLSAV